MYSRLGFSLVPGSTLAKAASAIFARLGSGLLQSESLDKVTQLRASSNSPALASGKTDMLKSFVVRFQRDCGIQSFNY